MDKMHKVLGSRNKRLTASATVAKGLVVHQGRLSVLANDTTGHHVHLDMKAA